MSGFLYLAEGADDMAHSAFEKTFAPLRMLDRLHNMFYANTLIFLSASYKRRGEIDKANALLSGALVSYRILASNISIGRKRSTGPAIGFSGTLAIFENS